MTITVFHDDQPDRVVDKINKALAEVGLEIKDDGEDHCGFLVYELATRTDGTPDTFGAMLKRLVELHTPRSGT